MLHITPVNAYQCFGLHKWETLTHVVGVRGTTDVNTINIPKQKVSTSTHTIAMIKRLEVSTQKLLTGFLVCLSVL